MIWMAILDTLCIWLTKTLKWETKKLIILADSSSLVIIMRSPSDLLILKEKSTRTCIESASSSVWTCFFPYIIMRLVSGLEDDKLYRYRRYCNNLRKPYILYDNSVEITKNLINILLIKLIRVLFISSIVSKWSQRFS